MDIHIGEKPDRLALTAERLRRVAHPLRLAMLELLRKRTELCVCVMAAALGAEQAPGSALAEVASYVVSVAAAGPHLLVVKTPPGIAPLVALDLDREEWPEVVGTVAGDDTFFVATAGRIQQARIEARLGALTRGERHA